MWFLMVFITNLGVGILLMMSGDANTQVSFLLLFAFLMSAAFFSWLVHDGRRPVAFVLFTYWCYGLVMPGLFQVRSDTFFWPSRAISEPLMTQAAGNLIVALVAFIAGYFLRRDRPAMFVHNAPAVETGVNVTAEPSGIAKHLSKRAIERAALIVVLISLGYTVLMFASFGPAFFFSTRVELSQAIAAAGLDSTGRGLTRKLTQALALSALAISGYLYMRSKMSSKMLKWVAIIALLGNFIANFPGSVPRYWMVATVFVLLYTWFYPFWNVFRRTIMVGIPALIYLIFPTLGSFNRRGTSVDWSLNLKSPAEFMTHGDLDGFQSLMNVHNMVAHEGVSYGSHLLSVVFFFVPRSFWGGKTGSVGAEAATEAGYQFTTISMPFPGEMYANFGWLGIVIGLFVLGVLVRRLDSAITRSDAPPAVASLAILTAAFMPILFRGSLLGSIGSFGGGLFLIALWWFFARVRFAKKQAKASRLGPNSLARTADLKVSRQ